MIAAKPIRAGGGHLMGGGAPGVVRPAPAQDIKRKSIIVGARGKPFYCFTVQFYSFNYDRVLKIYTIYMYIVILCLDICPG